MMTNERNETQRALTSQSATQSAAPAAHAHPVRGPGGVRGGTTPAKQFAQTTVVPPRLKSSGTAARSAIAPERGRI